MARTLIHNAVVVNEGKKTKGYVVVDGDIIDRVGKGAAPAAVIAGCQTVIDAGGAYLMPGVIDDHVHFRDPGLTHKGDIASESAAAVAGGVTSYMDMPNTRPATVSLDAWRDKMDRAAEVSIANYSFYIGATNDNLDTLLEADYASVPGVKLFLGSSTGNMLVDSEPMLRRMFSELPALIAVHAEDDARIRSNMETAREIFGEEPVPMELHPVIRDNVACYNATRRAIRLARETGARLHVLHVSTAAELGLLADKGERYLNITSETCIQYLWWSDADYETMGSRIKCNPAIKSDKDRRALRRAVRDGLIDVIGSDHAPHLLSEKDGDALTAPSGCPNMQFSLPMLMDLASEKAFKVETVAEKTSHAPARLFGIERRGFIREGYFADLVLVRAVDPYTVTDGMSVGKCGWIPIAGVNTQLHHRVEKTWVNGRLAYDEGIVNREVRGRALTFVPPGRDN